MVGFDPSCLPDLRPRLLLCLVFCLINVLLSFQLGVNTRMVKDGCGQTCSKCLTVFMGPGMGLIFQTCRLQQLHDHNRCVGVVGWHGFPPKFGPPTNIRIIGLVLMK